MLAKVTRMVFNTKGINLRDARLKCMSDLHSLAMLCYSSTHYTGDIHVITDD